MCLDTDAIDLQTTYQDPNHVSQTCLSHEKVNDVNLDISQMTLSNDATHQGQEIMESGTVPGKDWTVSTNEKDYIATKTKTNEGNQEPNQVSTLTYQLWK